MIKFVFTAIVLLSSCFAKAKTLNGEQLIAEAYEVLATLTSEPILNVEACVNDKGQIAVIYSADFRSNIAYVYDSEVQEFNEPIPYDKLNLVYGEEIEKQDLISVFKAKLGELQLTCARYTVVLESPF